jgi:hypothetical protein
LGHRCRLRLCRSLPRCLHRRCPGIRLRRDGRGLRRSGRWRRGRGHGLRTLFRLAATLAPSALRRGLCGR